MAKSNLNLTTYGNDPNKAAAVLDVYDSESLKGTMSPSLVDTVSDGAAELFDYLTPAQAQAVLEDHDTSAAAVASGGIKNYLNKVKSNSPAGIEGVIDRFSLAEIDSYTDRLSSVTTADQFNNMDTSVFGDTLDLAKEFTALLDTDGTYLDQINACRIKGISSGTLGLGDFGMGDAYKVGGFMNSSACSSSTDIVGDLLGLEIDDDLLGKAFEMVGGRVSSLGDVESTHNISKWYTDNVNLSDGPVGPLVENLVGSFEFSGSSDADIMRREGTRFIDVLYDMSPDWDGGETKQLSAVANMSPDAKDAMLADDRTFLMASVADAWLNVSVSEITKDMYPSLA